MKCRTVLWRCFIEGVIDVFSIWLVLFQNEFEEVKFF